MTVRTANLQDVAAIARLSDELGYPKQRSQANCSSSGFLVIFQFEPRYLGCYVGDLCSLVVRHFPPRFDKEAIGRFVVGAFGQFGSGQGALEIMMELE
jgi:hypothetical protein